MIEQRGDDPAVGRKAADTVKAIGSPEQTEEAYLMLARQFPADASAWLRLGDARLEAGKERLALDAYRRAAKTDPQNTDAHNAVARAEDVLRLDPTRRGLSVRERARRWDAILQRVIAGTAGCTTPEEIEKAKLLLKRRAFSIEASDRKMEVALRIWQDADASCKTDPVLTHIISKIRE